MPVSARQTPSDALPRHLILPFQFSILRSHTIHLPRRAATDQEPPVERDLHWHCQLFARSEAPDFTSVVCAQLVDSCLGARVDMRAVMAEDRGAAHGAWRRQRRGPERLPVEVVELVAVPLHRRHEEARAVAALARQRVHAS
eukprot:797515-Rhodomonas_salina.1